MHTSIHSGRTGNHPASPHAMVLTAYTYSPRRSGFLASVAREVAFANLTPASRRQDHTTWPSAISALVRSTFRVHRIPPRVRDDRDTPLVVGRDGDGYAGDLGSHGTEMFFPMGLDSPNHTKSSPSGARFFARRHRSHTPSPLRGAKRRSNPALLHRGRLLDCFAPLAMTEKSRAP
jgi:hypothetical protein